MLISAAVLFMPRMAYAAEIQMGADGMLVFEPCELTVDVGETVTFINNHVTQSDASGHEKLGSGTD